MMWSGLWNHYYAVIEEKILEHCTFRILNGTRAIFKNILGSSYLRSLFKDPCRELKMTGIEMENVMLMEKLMRGWITNKAGVGRVEWKYNYILKERVLLQTLFLMKLRVYLDSRFTFVLGGSLSQTDGNGTERPETGMRMRSREVLFKMKTGSGCLLVKLHTSVILTEKYTRNRPNLMKVWSTKAWSRMMPLFDSLTLDLSQWLIDFYWLTGMLTHVACWLLVHFIFSFFFKLAGCQSVGSLQHDWAEMTGSLPLVFFMWVYLVEPLKNYSWDFKIKSEAAITGFVSQKTMKSNVS